MKDAQLTGYTKKSFAIPFAGGEIWIEHLDSMYEYTDLAVKKLNADYEQWKRPSVTSLMAVNLYGTVIGEALYQELIQKIIHGTKRFSKVVFVGVEKKLQKRMKKEFLGHGFAVAFINDFEKAKEWLIFGR